MSYVLVSSTTYKQNGGVVIWDSLSGTAIASLPGEVCGHNTLMYTYDGKLITAVDKRPLLQYWAKDNPKGTFKRITTKDIVSALTCDSSGELLFIAIKKDIYIFQASSGCIVAILKNGHSATISCLLYIGYNGSNAPLLVSADNDGMVCCWDLASLIKNSSISYGEIGSDVSISPLWFAVRVSRNCPLLSSAQDNLLLTGGTSGVKVFDYYTGTLISETLTNEKPIFSICSVGQSNIVYCGSENGLLYCLDYETEQNKNEMKFNKVTRTCFMGEKGDEISKSIVSIIMPPLDKSILAVGTRNGFVEVLKNDRFLTRLKSFNIIQHGIKEDMRKSIKLTGLVFIPRPNWLSSVQSDAIVRTFKEMNNSETNKFEKGDLDRRKYGCIEQIKRKVGWDNNDVFYMKISKDVNAVFPFSLTSEEDMYMDDFTVPADYNFNSTSNIVSSIKPAKVKEVPPDAEDDDKIASLKKRIENLKMTNKVLLQRVVRAETHFS